MAIITLTTDFGEKDHFAGAVKGALYSKISDIKIVDISHSVSPFHLHEAAYIIQNAYKSFPEGTIHVIGVDAELHPENRHLAAHMDGHYFICADNGILSILTQDINPTKIVEINIHDRITSNFPVLDVFVEVAAHLARGGTLDVVGKTVTEVKEIKRLHPVVTRNDSQIQGIVIYVDNYGNVVSNIKRKFFETVRKGRPFIIHARTTEIKIIYERYSDAINFELPPNKRNEDGKKLAVWNSSGYLELAIYKSNPTSVGGASTLFGLEFRDTITVSFIDE